MSRPSLLALRFRLRRHLRGTGASIISSNCVGSRLSVLAGEPFNSPTVNLWMLPPDYLTFVERFADYGRLNGAFRPLPDETTKFGYPVVALGGGELPEIRLYLQHYHDVETAVSDWNRRFARIDPAKIVLTFTDHYATADDLKRFEALPYPKIVFTRLAWPEIKSAVCVPGCADDQNVGDLFSEWHRLAPVLTNSVLRRLVPR